MRNILFADATVDPPANEFNVARFIDELVGPIITLFTIVKVMALELVKVAVPWSDPTLYPAVVAASVMYISISKMYVVPAASVTDMPVISEYAVLDVFTKLLVQTAHTIGEIEFK